MKVILVAPGPRHSTYDVYRNLSHELNKVVDLVPFPYHNILDWHKSAQVVLAPHLEVEHMDHIAISRASRELLGDIAYHNPDVVFFIAGTAYPVDLYRHVKIVQHSFKAPFALGIYFTECPYMDSIQEKYLPMLDFAFFSDKLSAEKFNPGGNLYLDYLPHSYNSFIHTRTSDESYETERYSRDVFFCGTPFYERQEILASVNWDGIDLAISGLWEDNISEEYVERLSPYVFHDGTMPNKEVSRYYRHSKISVNIHRTRMDIGGNGEPLDNKSEAYSANPRVFEVVASGGFLVTDFRQEIEDLLGDTVLYFEDETDFGDVIKKALSMSDEERQNMKDAAWEKIKYCSFQNRVNDIIMPVFKDMEVIRWQKS
jgi:spore maturation protein CgeB